MLAPIGLFTYNRLNKTKQTVESLKLNHLSSQSELFIFSDGPKNEKDHTKVMEVRNYIKSITGFKNIQIIESKINLGLANSIINGISMIIEKYGKMIILEDDLISTPSFLNFMNNALDFYEQDKRIQSINGYSLFIKNLSNDIYFQVRPFPWGWATWADRWESDIFDKQILKNIIDTDKSILRQFKRICGNDSADMLLKSLNNKNDSWYIRWTFNHFRTKRYSVFPKYSYIQNIGFSDGAVHCMTINPYRTELANEKTTVPDLIDFQLPEKRLTRKFLRYFTSCHKLLVRIKLLPTKSGRQKIIQDFKIKTGLK